MSIAALTSSISMLEVPVAYVVETRDMARKKAAYLIGGCIALVSTAILLNFDSLFGLVITITTRYSQPLIGFLFCIYVGWVWHRDQLLQELRKGNPDIEQGLFAPVLSIQPAGDVLAAAVEQVEALARDRDVAAQDSAIQGLCQPAPRSA